MGFGRDLQASWLPRGIRCPEEPQALSTRMGPIVRTPMEPLVPGQMRARGPLSGCEWPGWVSCLMSLFVYRQWGQCRFPGVGMRSVFLPGKHRTHNFASQRGCFVTVALPKLSVESPSLLQCLRISWADPMILKGAPRPLVRSHRNNSPTKRGPSSHTLQSCQSPGHADHCALRRGAASPQRNAQAQCPHFHVPAPSPRAVCPARRRCPLAQRLVQRQQTC